MLGKWGPNTLPCGTPAGIDQIFLSNATLNKKMVLELWAIYKPTMGRLLKFGAPL